MSVRVFFKSFVLCVLAFLTFCMFGCQNQIAVNRFRNKVINAIDSRCEVEQSCRINMRDVTDFEWDKMVIYCEGVFAEDLNEALGIEYRNEAVFASGIVFMNNGEIVLEDSVKCDPEGLASFGYFVATRIDSRCAVFYPQNAILSGSKSQQKNYVRYVLWVR